MFTYIHNINTYVENQTGYKADKIKLELDEATFKVTAYPVDTDNVAIVGAPALVDKTCTDLDSAIKYYNAMENQISQGDVIRNI